eukprot:NODE_10643_length_1338_cov_4.066887.p1 GENE.NODE_10643_length_1338_cov_4.066887~~NODE_10643_length_1338_cov_4.066887.p1  ORF type:complete len:302 (-),score=69.49 NODE_10643_length_1338_cov_4.066887:320-1225(-)
MTAKIPHSQLDGCATNHVRARSDVGLTPLDHSVAGAVAQAATKAALFPIETWKNRRQAFHFGSTARFAGRWTLRGVYKGMVLKVILYAPCQAIYMATYTQARDGMLALPWPLGPGTCTFVAAGLCAELAATVVRLPAKVGVTRLQIGLYDNAWHALRDLVARPERCFVNFVPQTLLHDCACSALLWVVYERSRQMVFALRNSNELSGSDSVALGTFSSAIMALVTTPLDVLRVRVIVQSSGSRPSEGCWTVARQMWHKEGPRIFLSGAILRVMHLAPAGGMFLALYELSKTQIANIRGVTQ